MPRPDPGTLATGKVTYQAAQFLHLERFADVSWANGALRTAPVDAVIAWDEHSLLTDERVRAAEAPPGGLFVYVTHDFWCHPLQVAEELRRRERVLMVLRHESARRLFDEILPEVPKVVQRPGVETGIFRPADAPKTYDVLLSGSETPDYPVRQRLNRIVRERAGDYGWKVLDLTGVGLMSNAPGSQLEYAPALAATKVSPTGTNRGGGRGGALVMQYLDFSPARAQFDDPFFGLGKPEVVVRNYDTAGITPRYLESLATKTLLMGDLPAADAQEWYRDKMVVVEPELSDQEIAELIDRWVRDDEAREEVCERAYAAVVETETSERRAEELVAIVADHLRR